MNKTSDQSFGTQRETIEPYTNVTSLPVGFNHVLLGAFRGSLKERGNGDVGQDQGQDLVSRCPVSKSQNDRRKV